MSVSTIAMRDVFGIHANSKESDQLTKSVRSFALHSSVSIDSVCR